MSSPSAQIVAVIAVPLGASYALSARLLLGDLRERRALDRRLRFLTPSPAEGPYRSA